MVVVSIPNFLTSSNILNGLFSSLIPTICLFFCRWGLGYCHWSGLPHLQSWLCRRRCSQSCFSFCKHSCISHGLHILAHTYGYLLVVLTLLNCSSVQCCVRVRYNCWNAQNVEVLELLYVPFRISSYIERVHFIYGFYEQGNADHFPIY